MLPQPQKEAVIQESPSESQLLPHFPYDSINPLRHGNLVEKVSERRGYDEE